ncbi:MAG: ParB N-terminal domain-containing protein [Candidatus Riflebacteria bacterium]|nr:ParB N-terminal domain-containing protein [Candidatus Riflebacteria bacterium]
MATVQAIISAIKIPESRFRKDMGDIEALAKSIEEEGLLQPIGINRRNELVFGERRLKAVQMLGWDTVEVKIVNVSSILMGEYTENEMRKDFTPTERYAIKAAIEKEIGNRAGRPRQECELPKGIETREIAAKAAGFSSREQARRVGEVIEHGTPELVDAMDTGKVSISTAADIATLPEPEQVELVARGEKEILQAAKEIRQVKAEANKAMREQYKADIENGKLPRGML